MHMQTNTNFEVNPFNIALSEKHTEPQVSKRGQQEKDREWVHHKTDTSSKLWIPL